MRCFLPCFSASKSQKHFSSEPLKNANESIQQNPVLEESIHWISSESKEKVTPTKEEEECSDSLFSVSIGGGKQVSTEENAAETETEVNSSPMQLRLAKEVSLLNPIVPVTEGKDEKEEDRMEYRYRDCYDEDDGYDDINLDDEKTEKGCSESSESSLFSITTDFSNRKRISFSSSEKVDTQVTSKMVALQEDDGEVLSVLNPIENVTICEGKVKALNSIKKDKENINWIEEMTSLKVSSSSSKRNMKEEIGVDTSLSDWLVESENKENVIEDRAILRALRVEEIRKCKSNKCAKDGKQDRSSTTIKSILEPKYEGLRL